MLDARDGLAQASPASEGCDSRDRLSKESATERKVRWWRGERRSSDGEAVQRVDSGVLMLHDG